ncbi:MAG: M20/M25/M40 family metallo-hydrolase [Chloroflexi bacterium]|nr:M20/M25/M40 family metallo-hydrolase [Chloroflexota bacterium]
MTNSQKTNITTAMISIGALFVAISIAIVGFIPPSSPFDGDRALASIEYQLSLGPRVPGSPGHAQLVEWLQDELEGQGWDTHVQEAVMMDHPIKNIIATRGENNAAGPWIILGAHYDTRIYADRDADPEKRGQPVPGANDGASGVAVLLELARILPEDTPGAIWLIFFDAEDNGRISGWDWVLGSRAFVETLSEKPDAVVIVDMIGDADLNILMEKSSDQSLTSELWEQAAASGYSNHFIPLPGRNILDDHTPFLQAGIPAVDLIDIDYPYWHTTEDTLDKVSAESLQAVGDTLFAWIVGQDRTD